jgi:hypothetical protein
MRLKFEKALMNWPSSIHNSWINGWLTTEMHQSQPDSLSQNQPTTTGDTILHAKADIFHKILQPSSFGVLLFMIRHCRRWNMQLSELDIRILAHKIIISEILKLLLAIQSDH